MRHGSTREQKRTELCEDAHVGALEADARLQESDELLEVPPRLVEGGHLLQVVGVDDDVQPAQLRQAELRLLHACIAHLRVHASECQNEQRRLQHVHSSALTGATSDCSLTAQTA